MSLRRRSAAASRRASGPVEALALVDRALLLDPALRGFLALVDRALLLDPALRGFLALVDRALLVDPALRGFLAVELEARDAPADAPAVERLG
ncbi:MAG: hypothetical protein M3076_07785 [Actinomycetota bacterium]|nr:hypothetical protein [Actinomycetota bacterium]